MLLTREVIKKAKASIQQQLLDVGITVKSTPASQMVAATLGFKSNEALMSQLDEQMLFALPSPKALENWLNNHGKSSPVINTERLINNAFAGYSGFNWRSTVIFKIYTITQDEIEENAKEEGIDVSSLDWSVLSSDSRKLKQNIMRVFSSSGIDMHVEFHEEQVFVGRAGFDTDNPLHNYLVWIALDEMEGEGWETHDWIFSKESIFEGLSETGVKVLSAQIHFMKPAYDVPHQDKSVIKEHLEFYGNKLMFEITNYDLDLLKRKYI